jgi:diguanylate cyclase
MPSIPVWIERVADIAVTEGFIAALGAVCLLHYVYRTIHVSAIEREAVVDPLTGLANRREFDARLTACTQSSLLERRECSLVLMDIDHFKSVNDRHGHQAGDETLKAVAKVLTEECRRIAGSGPIAARYGGEELAAILPGAGPEEAWEIAESIRCRLASTPIRCGDLEIPVTLSAGVATAPRHAGGGHDLLAVADALLYRAKQRGRNRVEVAKSACLLVQSSSQPHASAPNVRNRQRSQDCGATPTNN